MKAVGEKPHITIRNEMFLITANLFIRSYRCQDTVQWHLQSGKITNSSHNFVSAPKIFFNNRDKGFREKQVAWIQFSTLLAKQIYKPWKYFKGQSKNFERLYKKGILVWDLQTRQCQGILHHSLNRGWSPWSGISWPVS